MTTGTGRPDRLSSTQRAAVEIGVDAGMEASHSSRTEPGLQPERRTIHEIIKTRAARNPDATAVAAPGRRPLSYDRLLQQVESTVAALRGFGVNSTDRVAMVMPNGPEMAVAFTAVAAGAACAPLNPSYRENEFDFLLSDLNARALIIAAGMASPAREVARQHDIPILELSWSAETEAGLFVLTGKASSAAGSGGFSAPEDVALVLHTSGTTARPKMVPLTQANICSSGRNISSTLQLTEHDRCLNVMPLFHIHGLIGALMSSLAAGASVVCSPGFAAETFFEWVDSCQPTWYTAVPTIHQAILGRAEANREIIRRRPMRFIRSSSASLPEATMAELERVFGTQVIEAYSMTEASHQMTSNPLAPLPRKPGSVGMAAGPDVAIMGQTGNLLPAGEIGEVVIRGSSVTDGYEGNPAANQSAFTHGWFRTGDQGLFDADGYLFLKGRLKEIINRGGEKISPREVDDVLLQHPAVAQAVAFAVPHPTLGEDVAAAVVLKTHASATESEIRTFAAGRLADFKVPKQLLILEEIPKGPTGKVQRIGLAEKLADELVRKRESNFVAAESSVETELTGMWERLLKTSRVGVRDDFHALGGDSLAMAAMLTEVEERFNREIPVDSFLGSPTIETLVRCIEADETAVAGAIEKRSAPPITDSVLAWLEEPAVPGSCALYSRVQVDESVASPQARGGHREERVDRIVGAD